jgi:subtilisin family serine protease
MVPGTCFHDPALQQSTGRKVKVAVIDSGINAHHSHVRRISGGVGIACDPSGSIVFSDDHRDYDGHGTAVAGILRAKAPDVELYSVRVLQDRLRTESRVLAAAIRSCIANDIRVINLSLGTLRISEIDPLRHACEVAAEREIILVAAGSEEERILPASLSCVVSVSADECCGWNDYAYHESGYVEFRAHPWPRPLPGRAQTGNLRGHSMATAHVSALVARIVEAYPQAGLNEVRRSLIRECTRAVSGSSDVAGPRSTANGSFSGDKNLTRPDHTYVAPGNGDRISDES